MQIIVNGQPREAADGVSVTDLVRQLSDREAGIAVALNSEVVPRGSWADTTVAAGDRIDVVTAVQGG
ncbi:sulfur carrier protein ThiS [Jatrophihabitans lederbergiae]|jgi:sulfur carrier protein|uniref:Sulfur carrier protein ThiS n=1 Tax=Jatrophihabitans lederbergiae TaxID=3075547 RepID=A0ABU2J677_9ACTN|nr:sulfur carrier protein ThiS [Jatrophihabitans sp. DSM 44399]MDT0260094.1 sulfur carrier protein ThiS [Jatrophihabitans sp. DSM 44399]